jgi:hypothetical protein
MILSEWPAGRASGLKWDMYSDFLIPCSMVVLLGILVGILFFLFNSLGSQRNWAKSWQDLAARTGLNYKETSHGPGVSGMYAGRIVNLLGTHHSGTSVLLTTDNHSNNHLTLKAKGGSAHNDEPLDKLFSVECKSSEFKNELFSSPTLSRRIAPLARERRASLNLSGEELSFTTPRVILNVEELIDTLDILCDFSRAIEEVGSKQSTQFPNRQLI